MKTSGLVFSITVVLHGFSLIASVFPSAALSEPVYPIEDREFYYPEEVALGKILFNSPLLSRDNSISCASCHNLAEGGDDGLPVAVGVDGKRGEINTPSVFNSGLNPFQFWDGRAPSLEAQVSDPVHHPLEMDSSWPEVIGKLEKEPGIKKMFNQFYSDGINAVNIAKAIAAFERRLITVSSPFDRYLYGKADAISEKAKSGYQLFKNMGCVSCHQGQNLGGNLFQYFGVMDNYFQDRGNIKKADYGRYNVTGKEEDRFKFKVPSLRNIALTAPYFHDASAETLGDAIRVMARYQLGRPITESQVDQIEAFLLTLTGEVEEELK